MVSVALMASPARDASSNGLTWTYPSYRVSYLDQEFYFNFVMSQYRDRNQFQVRVLEVTQNISKCTNVTF